MDNREYVTYKNSVMTRGKDMFQTASYMAKEKMCAYPSSQYYLSDWKYVLCFCAECPRINMHSFE